MLASLKPITSNRKNLTHHNPLAIKIFGFILSTLVLLSACKAQDNNLATNQASSDKIITNIAFQPVPLATTIDEIKSMRVSQQLTVTYEDNSRKIFPLEFKQLIAMGDKIGSHTFGMLVDARGNPLTEKDGSFNISQNPDGNSFIKTGGKNYLITHMESHPGILYKTTLELCDSDLKVIETAVVDLSKIDGSIINCASTKTPWNTHIGGEEDYSLNGIFSDSKSPFYMQCEIQNRVYTGAIVDGKQTYYCKYIQSMQNYLDDADIDRNNGYNGKIFTPYNYGYSIEVKINPDGSTQTARHYVTGKYTPELAIVMPDKKTVYMTDDGTAKGFWKFVSDLKLEDFNDNWQGTLYAAKVHQLSAKNGGEFNLSWIKLGHASDNQIHNIVKSKTKITDIFEVMKPSHKHQCEADFKLIYEDDMLECLRLKPGKALAAAFLESRKYAAYLGATIEFRKEEGITYSAKHNKLYLAMSSIDKSMQDNYQEMETSNDIRLPANPCGGVYELSLDDDYSVNHMKALFTGTPLKTGAPLSDQNYCDPNKIANPDNISTLGSDHIIVSEDSIMHLNNMSWAYNILTAEKTRIASLPIGAEVTGVANAVVGDQAFLIINQQHPFKDMPVNRAYQKVFPELFENSTKENLTATIGYIKGIPKDVFVE